MSNDRPGEPLANEDRTAMGAHGSDIAWRLLRLALILWASIVIVRHASYWLSSIYLVGARSAITPARPILFAAAELIVLAAIVFLSIRSSPRPTFLGAIKSLALAYIVINLAAFVIDTRNSGTPLSDAMGLKFIWLLASRIQLLVVPALAVAAPRSDAR